MNGSEDPRLPLSVTVTVGVSIGETGPFEDIDALERRMAERIHHDSRSHKARHHDADDGRRSVAARDRLYRMLQPGCVSATG